MFSLPGIAGLVVLIILRPFEFIEGLRGVPFLYIFFALAVFGFIIDLRLGHTELRTGPQWSWMLAFVGWCLVTTAIATPSQLGSSAAGLSVLVLLFTATSFGVQSFRALEFVAALVLACALIVATVCTHQSMQPFTCVAVGAGEEASSRGISDGRPCTEPGQCLPESPDPELLYRCEKNGVFGLTSIAGGRVRYAGVLQDPNEVAMVLSMAVPLAFAFRERRRTKFRWMVLVATVLLVGFCTLETKSRGGQLVFLTVLGFYFVKRRGWAGVAIGAACIAPVLAFGGRAGREADESAVERLQCWWEGMYMFRTHPLFGVGFDRFGDYHYLTAHNSFVLALAELGFPGMMLWTGLLYISIKMPWVALRAFNAVPEAQPARTWGVALVASFAGLLAGVFFLSFNYHYVLWIWLGLAGAFYGAVTSHSPAFRVRMGCKDLAFLAVGNACLVVVLFVYTRWKTGG